MKGEIRYWYKYYILWQVVGMTSSALQLSILTWGSMGIGSVGDGPKWLLKKLKYLASFSSWLVLQTTNDLLTGE